MAAHGENSCLRAVTGLLSVGTASVIAEIAVSG
jgi:hypothetical protein